MEIRIIEVLLYTIAGLFIAIFFIISWVDGLNNFTLKIKCEKTLLYNTFLLLSAGYNFYHY